MWIRLDPELFSGSGFGINHFESGSGQHGSGINLIPNFLIQGSKKHRIQDLDRIRIRIPDLDPGAYPGFGSGSETGQNFLFLYKNF